MSAQKKPCLGLMERLRTAGNVLGPPLLTSPQSLSLCAREHLLWGLSGWQCRHLQQDAVLLEMANYRRETLGLLLQCACRGRAWSQLQPSSCCPSLSSFFLHYGFCLTRAMWSEQSHPCKQTPTVNGAYITTSPVIQPNRDWY